MVLYNKCECVVFGKRYVVKVGDIFNRLIVKGLYRNKESKWYAVCQCTCENKTERHVLVRNLITENTKSCGCFNKELCIKRSTKHNLKHRNIQNKLYTVWVEMRRRCNTKTCKSYKDYGLRGITVCDEWSNFLNFKKWAESSGYIDGLTIERLNVNDGYYPENCTWIPKSEQSKNRRMCHYIDYEGYSMTVSDWSRKLGINRSTINRRLQKGLPINEVFENKHYYGDK